MPADANIAAVAPLLSIEQLFLNATGGNRSLNLSNAAAVVVYEAWRQLGFASGR